MIRIVAVVKSDSVYKKIRQLFPSPQWEVLRNISNYMELQEFILGDDADVAIIDQYIPWKSKGDELLREYNTPVYFFEGDFEALTHKIYTAFRIHSGGEAEEDGGTGKKEQPVTQNPKLQDREVRPQPKPEDRPLGVQRSEPVIEYRDRIVEKPVERIVEKKVEVPVEVQVEVPVPYAVEKETFVAIPRQLIVVGSMYGGAGSSFTTLALAKLLDALRIQTWVMEFPRNDPYLYYALDGFNRLPRNYAYFYPQIMGDKKAFQGGKREEWTDGNVTWVPLDPSTGSLTQWNNEHMLKTVYKSRGAITLLDISTAWDDPALEDVISQAHHQILVSGPFPAKLTSATAKGIVRYLKEDLNIEPHMIANGVPNMPMSKEFKDWYDSFPFRMLCRVPQMNYEKVVKAAWNGKTVLDDNSPLVKDYFNAFYPLLKEIIPKGYLVEMRKKYGAMAGLSSKIRTMFKKDKE